MNQMVKDKDIKNHSFLGLWPMANGRRQKAKQPAGFEPTIS